MTQAQALSIDSTQASARWHSLCQRQDLVPNSGVVAWFAGAQIALFYLPLAEGGERVYAIENRDPQAAANVIGRGIVGSIKGAAVVASPIYKQHYRLEDGQCLEHPDQVLQVWPARLNGDRVEILATGNRAAVNL